MMFMCPNPSAKVPWRGCVNPQQVADATGICTHTTSCRELWGYGDQFYVTVKLGTRTSINCSFPCRPISVSFIRRVNENRLTDEQCEKIYNRSVRLETDFVQYFSSIVAGDGFEDVYDKVKHLIKTHSTNKIWVPANEMF